MKTYILSVNTLTWNLTSERHDNCAPCLGLILPIRWVTPPPNFLVWSVSLMALLLQRLRIWFVFSFNLSSWFSALWWSDCIYIYTSILSSTAFTYSYVFTFGLASISTYLHDYLHYVDYIDIYILVFCPLQHSLIAMSSCWIFWTKWMWSDPNLSMLSISNSISPNHMHSIETVECLLCVLVSRRYRDNH